MQLCVEGNLRYFTKLLKQRKNCEIATLLVGIFFYNATIYIILTRWRN